MFFPMTMDWFKGKFTGKPNLMGKSMVSCRFSRENQSIDYDNHLWSCDQEVLRQGELL
jgi:hypothetical protein